MKKKKKKKKKDVKKPMGPSGVLSNETRALHMANYSYSCIYFKKKKIYWY